MTVLFIVSLVLIIYIFVGYPCILYFLSRNRESTVEKSDTGLDLSILMVVCNEEDNVHRKIQNLLALDYFGDKPELIIVDDYSLDNTVAIIESFKNNRIKLIRLSKRGGKANGINVAMESVSTELVLMVDVRQLLELNVAENLSSWFLHHPDTGAISGELLFKNDGVNEFSKGMDSYWQYEKFIRKSEAKISSVPGVTGAIYMLRRSLFKPIAVDTILDDVLIPMNIIAQGYRVGFDDRSIAWDIPSFDVENEKRRKIRTIEGNYQLLFRNLSWCLPFGHPIWCQYLSHKVLRLFAPFIAFLHVFSSFILSISGPLWLQFYTASIVFLLALYPLSLIFPKLIKIKLIRIWVSFIVLNWFSVLGFFSYLFGQKKQSWK